MLVVNLNRSRDAPFEMPMLVKSFHASSINLRRLDSAFGAGSVATTSNPRAKYSAAQLAPMTPVPTTAMRRIGLLYDIISVYLRFHVSDSVSVTALHAILQRIAVIPISAGRDTPQRAGEDLSVNATRNSPR
jgi:hypothetical protein